MDVIKYFRGKALVNFTCIALKNDYYFLKFESYENV